MADVNEQLADLKDGDADPTHSRLPRLEPVTREPHSLEDHHHEIRRGQGPQQGVQAVQQTAVPR